MRIDHLRQLAIIHVDLDQGPLALGLSETVLEDGPQHQAGTAPTGSEIDDVGSAETTHEGVELVAGVYCVVCRHASIILYKGKGRKGKNGMICVERRLQDSIYLVLDTLFDTFLMNSDPLNLIIQAIPLNLSYAITAQSGQILLLQLLKSRIINIP
jgi:hypothetical protein